jgi:hypothetical protein
MPRRHMGGGGGGGIAPSFLTSALDGGDWSASRHCRFTNGKGAPDTLWRRSWVDLIADMDVVENRII